tara:strand:+ start:1301 stop:1489 length:189 start_codon:yes stop_codon:yes gene_type:complete
MIYLKKISVNNPDGLNAQIKEYKDSDTKTVKFLEGTGQWVRVKGLKDPSSYSAPKKSKKKSK